MNPAPALPDFSRIPMNATEVIDVARYLGIPTPTIVRYRNGTRLVAVTLPGFPRPSKIRIPAPRKPAPRIPAALLSADGRASCAACDALDYPTAMIATTAGHYCAQCAPQGETA